MTTLEDIINEVYNKCQEDNQNYANILISIFNKQGDVYRRINCKDVFPLKALPEMGLNYTDEGIYTINDMEFAVDYYDDLFL